jgi:Icc-related predicted phosphoesterase
MSVTSETRSRLWIMSDLHQEYERLRYTPPDDVDHDVVILAGDIDKSPAHAMAWALEKFDKPVIYVAGNHEFYGNGVIPEIREARLLAASEPDIHFLENSSVVVAGVRYVGCTLWTDFDLYGADNRQTAMRYGSRNLGDFDQILLDDATIKHMPTRFKPHHARAFHEESRKFLDEELSTPFDGPTVVVTHHAPATGSINHKFSGDALTPCFVSDLESLIVGHAPDMWIHGHVHDSFDYTLGRTRIVCNPKGYEIGNPEFEPSLVVSV